MVRSKVWPVYRGMNQLSISPVIGVPFSVAIGGYRATGGRVRGVLPPHGDEGVPLAHHVPVTEIRFGRWID